MRYTIKREILSKILRSKSALFLLVTFIFSGCASTITRSTENEFYLGEKYSDIYPGLQFYCSWFEYCGNTSSPTAEYALMMPFILVDGPICLAWDSLLFCPDLISATFSSFSKNKESDQTRNTECEIYNSDKDKNFK